jgi:hypothetical protein
MRWCHLALGSIPSEIKSLVNIMELELYSGRLTGTIPIELTQLANLTELIINSNSFSGVVPSQFGQLSSLNSVDVGYNSLLTGSLPRELCAVPLIDFQFNDNMFTGPIIDCLSADHLAYYFVDSNFMTSTISSQLGLQTKMLEFNVGYNFLSGSLAGEILEKWTRLQVVAVSNNLITGSLPTVLGTLKDMLWLDYSVNQLTGALQILSCIMFRSLCLHVFIVRYDSYGAGFANRFPHAERLFELSDRHIASIGRQLRSHEYPVRQQQSTQRNNPIGVQSAGGTGVLCRE